MGTLKLCCYDEFNCIADKCTYSCCGSGWRVALKPEEAKMYRSEPFIKRGLRDDDSAIRMKENGDCFFLDKNGLCELIKKYGPDVLSFTCTVFPRNGVSIKGVKEQTLSNACPWVVELLDGIVPPLSFVYEGEDMPEEYSIDTGVNCRNVMIDILQFTEIPLWIRVYLIYMLADKLKETPEENWDGVINSFCNPEYLVTLSGLLSEKQVDFAVLLKLGFNMYNMISAENVAKSYTKSFIKDYCGKNLSIDIAEAEKAYEEFKLVLRRKMPLLENVAVNYAFRHLCTGNADELRQRMAILVILLSMSAFNAFLVFLYKGELENGMFYDIVSYYARIFEHNSIYANSYMEYLFDEKEFNKGNFFFLCKILDEK